MINETQKLPPSNPSRLTVSSVRSSGARRLSRVALLLGFALLIASVIGCKENQESKTVDAPVEEEVIAPDPIKMLVVGDPGVAPMIARQWKARREGIVTVENQSVEDFVNGGLNVADDIDVVIYPPSFLGELAINETIEPVPQTEWNSRDLNKNELLKHFRSNIVRFDNQPWAVPLGSPNLSMLCNVEAFEKAETTPPDTWEKVESRLKKLSKVLDGDLEAKIDLPLAKDWAAVTFLARLAPAIRHRGQLSTVFERRSMKPMIDSQTAIEALEQLKKVATKRSVDLNPRQVFDLALKGESTVGFSWPSRPEDSTSEGEPGDDANEDAASDSERSSSVSIHPLPGVAKYYNHETQIWNTRVNEEEIHVDLIGFAGLVASVPRKSQNKYTAWEFLTWLSGKSISSVTLVNAVEAGPFRASHLGDVSSWTGNELSIDVLDQYADVISDNHRRPLVLMFPRIPKQQEYLDVLDRKIREYFIEDVSAEVVLQDVAKEWNAITETVGANKQSRILRKEAGF